MFDTLWFCCDSRVNQSRPYSSLGAERRRLAEAGCALQWCMSALCCRCMRDAFAGLPCPVTRCQRMPCSIRAMAVPATLAQARRGWLFSNVQLWWDRNPERGNMASSTMVQCSLSAALLPGNISGNNFTAPGLCKLLNIIMLKLWPWCTFWLDFLPAPPWPLTYLLFKNYKSSALSECCQPKSMAMISSEGETFSY